MLFRSKQGVIDLSGLTSTKAIKDKLMLDTGIGTGAENPNVVHSVSYEDYGRQVETHEHSTDKYQLVGTQIRKLITADMSEAEDFTLTVEGVTMTKKEWLDHYNAINTENILEAFVGISEIFADKKQIEAVLQEEIRTNPRYGIEMMRACTLDENGNPAKCVIINTYEDGKVKWFKTLSPDGN